MKAEGGRGSAAAETLTGSRVATKIVGLPDTVNVMTSEFLADFVIVELDDTLAQTGRFAGLNSGDGLTLRGFASTAPLREGCFHPGRLGARDVERSEIIQGSNAATYGRTPPAGMMNLVALAPKAKADDSLSADSGDETTRRGSIDATGPVYRGERGETSGLFTVTPYPREFVRAHGASRIAELYLALRPAFQDSSSFMRSADYFRQVRHAPGAAVPIIPIRDQVETNLPEGRSLLAGDSARRHRLQAGSCKSRESHRESELELSRIPRARRPTSPMRREVWWRPCF